MLKQIPGDLCMRQILSFKWRHLKTAHADWPSATIRSCWEGAACLAFQSACGCINLKFTLGYSTPLRGSMRHHGSHCFDRTVKESLTPVTAGTLGKVEIGLRHHLNGACMCEMNIFTICIALNVTPSKFMAYAAVLRGGTFRRLLAEQDEDAHISRSFTEWLRPLLQSFTCDHAGPSLLDDTVAVFTHCLSTSILDFLTSRNVVHISLLFYTSWSLLYFSVGAHSRVKCSDAPLGADGLRYKPEPWLCLVSDTAEIVLNGPKLCTWSCWSNAKNTL